MTTFEEQFPSFAEEYKFKNQIFLPHDELFKLMQETCLDKQRVKETLQILISVLKNSRGDLTITKVMQEKLLKDFEELGL